MFLMVARSKNVSCRFGFEALTVFSVAANHHILVAFPNHSPIVQVLLSGSCRVCFPRDAVQ